MGHQMETEAKEAKDQSHGRKPQEARHFQICDIARLRITLPFMRELQSAA